jgi:NADPH-dependent 7-cyano-7-deazaguanine reductase QueF
MELKTQPNEDRCASTWVTHKLALPKCCPVTGNPFPGSEIEITYTPNFFILEVAALHAYIQSYVGGRGDVRSMEGMIQNIAQDCSNCIEQTVKVIANLSLEPTQKMRVECITNPND